MEKNRHHIVIKGIGSISPLGADYLSIEEAFAKGEPKFGSILHNGNLTPVAALSPSSERKLQEFVQANPTYNSLDRSVLLAIYAARQAANEAGWLNDKDHSFQDDLAVNIGSSRGATGLFEHHIEAFNQSKSGRISPSASPTTTLGNLSSWVAHAVNAGGAQISHSITCSTALMGIANGMAWLRAGMAKRFLAGGTEAPLTPFTIAQMKAVGIYSKLADSTYPCRPYNGVQNTFVLGEGACVFALKQENESDLKQGDVIIKAVGFGFEQIESKTGISPGGLNFQKAMRHALDQLSEPDRHIDLIITHTPGTKSGDKAELAAIEIVFGKEHPILTTNKWLIGHTLGASGALSIQYALHIFNSQVINPTTCYKINTNKSTPNSFKRIMVNAAGFGGNAACIILEKYN